MFIAGDRKEEKEPWKGDMVKALEGAAVRVSVTVREICMIKRECPTVWDTIKTKSLDLSVHDKDGKAIRPLAYTTDMAYFKDISFVCPKL